MTSWMRGALLAAPLLTLAAMPAMAQEPKIDAGNTAWMIVATCLVLMMAIPGISLFYAGMVRKKNILSTMMQSFFVCALVAVAWTVVGYSIAFGNGGLYFGDFSKVMLNGINWNGPFVIGYGMTGDPDPTVATTIPETVFFMFQMTFAIVTAALIFGAVADRMKFSAVCLFIVPWSILVYAPIAHAVWHPAGLIWSWGALDFAGGTVVHINAGIAGLVGCLVIGKRLGYKTENMSPHSLVMTMIGASLLWVGWFGFNAGSNLEANGVTAVAFINTFVATAAATVAWAVIEQIVNKKPSLLGAATGAVAGLVAITPASGLAAPMTSILLGFTASIVCFFFVTTVKNKLGYDDSLDVFGVHCIGGIVGAIGTGIVADPALGGQGFFDYTVFPAVVGEYDMAAQVITQIKAVGVTVLWSGIVSAVLFYALKLTIGLRPSPDVEQEGLDIAEHGERAYNY